MTHPVMIVSGASRGLGEAAAIIAAGMGAMVVVNARTQERLELVAAQIQAAGGVALVAPGDVSLRVDCERVVKETITRFGRLDALINNAGVLQPIATFADADPDDWERNLAVNIFGTVNLTRAALPHLRASQGRVIHVSSGAALNPYRGFGAYCLSKAAINHFNRLLALEEPWLTSIVVRPGKVDTEMQAIVRQQGARGMDPATYEHHLSLFAQGELLPPEAPGRALALLALHAPLAWSGEFIQWDDPRIQTLV